MSRALERSDGNGQPQSAEVAEAVVAGHICLDLIPDLGGAGLEAFQTPGALVHVGGAVVSTGGAVANSGLALSKLGVRTRLMGKIGDDPFGGMIASELERQCDGSSGGLIVSPGERSSYSIVVSPRGADRIFLHCPGTNDTFRAADVRLDALAGTRLLHFGYPPLMAAMVADEGRELERLLAGAKQAGLTVSLDMSRPDPESQAGRLDWRRLLMRVLPHVDLFLPSWEETVFMLEGRMPMEALPSDRPDGAMLERLAEMSEALLAMGSAVVGIKLGEAGLYVRTSSDEGRLLRLGAAAPADLTTWRGRELWTSCFEVEVKGTTGAGDCTIAGYLCGLLHGLTAERVMTAAVAVGAYSVETLDAASGIEPWEQVEQRIALGWPRRGGGTGPSGWQACTEPGVWAGPYDKSYAAPV